MESELTVRPLPRRKRRLTFLIFLGIFVISLPFLFLYATGYEFHFFGDRANIVATGGIYVDVERDDAEVYIDGELVREKRVFRRAFYAQNLEVGTHRVHVQKTDHHTWVKELPVSKYLVTEVHAFNLPLVSQVRVVAPYVSATGTPIVTTALVNASTTNEIIATTTQSMKKFTKSPEFESLMSLFGTTSTATAPRQQTLERVEKFFTATTTATATADIPTTTKEWGGVRLHEARGDVYATWEGGRENTPYYYCADTFPPYSTSTAEALTPKAEIPDQDAEPVPANPEFIHPVQTIPVDTDCEPTIRIDRKGQEVRSFDFYPGSTDLVLMSLTDGVYVVEIDNRAWQNVQPLILGKDLVLRVSNGQIYVYDGTLIYQVITEDL